MNYIFDFDGTIVDSLPAIIAVYNKNVRSSDNPISADEIERLRGMTSRRAIRALGVHWWQVPKLLLSGLGDFHALVPTMDPCKGIPEVVKKLHERGDKLYIVTSNTREIVDEFLARHDMQDYFIDMKTGSSLFKKSKHIRKLIAENKLKRRETVYIGDETRDIQAGRLAFIRVVSVTWGFNTRKILKRQRPNFLIDEPKELLKLKLGKKS